jgi:hypothetical protein
MRPDEDFSEPIELQSGGILPTLRFKSPGEMARWFESERSFWTDLSSKTTPTFRGDGNSSNLMSQLVQQASTPSATVQQFMQRDTPQTDYYNVALGFINHVNAGTLISAKQRIGMTLQELAASAPDHAARAAICYAGLQIQVPAQSWLPWTRAAALAEVLRRGLVAEVGTIDKMITQTQTKWDNIFNALEKEQKSGLQTTATSRTQAAELLTESATLLQGTRDQCDTTISKYAEAVTKAIGEGTDKILAIADTYNTQLALQAPTDYWKRKRHGHRVAAVIWGAAFGFVLWKLTAAPFLAWTQIHPAFVPSYGVFLPTLGAAFLSVWILRVISRQFLSNMAFNSDADERITMVMTFLALMQKPDHVRETDRVLILSALFRPATRTEEDGAPPNWFDLVMQRIKPP